MLSQNGHKYCYWGLAMDTPFKWFYSNLIQFATPFVLQSWGGRSRRMISPTWRITALVSHLIPTSDHCCTLETLYLSPDQISWVIALKITIGILTFHPHIPSHDHHDLPCSVDPVISNLFIYGFGESRTAIYYYQNHQMIKERKKSLIN